MRPKPACIRRPREPMTPDDFGPAAMVSFGGGDDLALEGLFPDVVAFDLRGDGEDRENIAPMPLGS